MTDLEKQLREILAELVRLDHRAHGAVEDNYAAVENFA